MHAIGKAADACWFRILPAVARDYRVGDAVAIALGVPYGGDLDRRIEESTSYLALLLGGRAVEVLLIGPGISGDWVVLWVVARGPAYVVRSEAAAGDGGVAEGQAVLTEGRQIGLDVLTLRS